MPKGQAPKQTVASMRTEVQKLYNRVDAQDAKIDSSTLLKIKRKLQNMTGIGTGERKSLLSRIDKLEAATTTKKQQNKDAKG